MRAAGWLLTLGSAGALAAGALAYSRRPKVIAIPRPEAMPATFGPLTTGSYYRAWVSAPEDADADAVEQRLRAYGFDPLLVSRDPTDDRVRNAVGVWRDQPVLVQNTEPIWIYRVDAVDAPPPPDAPAPPTLDVGMTSTDARAIDAALKTETDPSELRGFGDACRYDYPVASALLSGRADEIAAGRRGESPLSSGVEEPASRKSVNGVLAKARILARELLGTTEPSNDVTAEVSGARVGLDLGTGLDLGVPVLRRDAMLESSVQPFESLYAQRQLDDLNARILRSATARVSFADERTRADEEASWMVGRDEYGTPVDPRDGNGEQCPMGAGYLRNNLGILDGLKSWDASTYRWCNRNHLGLPLYLPRFPPAPNYDAWPERLRRWVPRDWSGDATLKPAYPGMTVEESRDPTAVVRNPLIFEIEWNYEHEDFLRTYLANYLTELSENGWGRYHLLRSAVTGEQAVPVHWGFKLTITTRTVFDEIWELTSAVGKAIARACKSFAGVLSLIPGLGTALSMAITCAASLALGEDLGEVVTSTLAAALPGGQIARAAFDTAAKTIGGLIDGKPLDEALLDGLRAAAIGAARIAGGDIAAEYAACAFDAGIAVAGGQGLQALGFGILYRLVPGGSMAERGVRFAEAASRAAQQGTDVGTLLLGELQRDLQPLGDAMRASSLGRAVDAVVESVRREALGPASLLSLSPEDVARRLGVPEPVARAAQAVVGLLEDGTPVVDEALLGELKPPPAVSRESALKVASYEEQRLDRYGHLEKSAILVARPAELPVALREVAVGVANGDAEAIAAREEIDRASRVLRRQAYVQRYLAREMAA